MTLAIAVYVPEGIIMATDSRQSITVPTKTAEGEDLRVQTVNSDAVTKTFLLGEQKIGISHFGQDMLARVPMSSHIRRFIEEKVTRADDIENIPHKLAESFKDSFGEVDVGFHVGGYKKGDRLSVPHVYYCHVGRYEIVRRNVAPDGAVAYGATWSGEIDVLASIINPVTVRGRDGKERVIRAPAPIVWGAMTIQDAVDFAIYAIRTSIDTMRFQARPKTIGGPIDVLLLTADKEPVWIQKKEYAGEQASQ